MNENKYISLLEAENARLENELSELLKNNELLDGRMRESLRRAFMHLPENKSADADAYYYQNTLEMIEKVRALNPKTNLVAKGV